MESVETTNRDQVGSNVNLKALRTDNSHAQIKVSMLFCDIVDSTKLSLNLSPLQLRDLMLNYYSITSEIVHDLGGTLIGYRGDGMLAAFGNDADYSDKDTAIRATTAGMELVENIRQAQTLTTSYLSLSVRLAVATGYVVPGELTDRESTKTELFGHTPYLAARLQTVAPDNTVVCSAETQLLIKSSYQTRFIGWKALKGFCHETPVWKIVRW